MGWTVNWFRLKTCIKCQGDLAADEGDWICLQCGTYYYTGLYQFQSNAGSEPQAPDSAAPERSEQKAAAARPTPAFSAFAYSSAGVATPAIVSL